jgi:hypothetical protein
MSKRELIVQELDHVAEQDLDKLIEFLQTLRDMRPQAAIRTPAAESSLAKDWLTPEEDAAWANL